MKNYIALFAVSIKKLKKKKCCKYKNKDEEIFKEQESIEILKFLCLIINMKDYQMNA